MEKFILYLSSSADINKLVGFGTMISETEEFDNEINKRVSSQSRFSLQSYWRTDLCFSRNYLLTRRERSRDID